MLQIRRYCLMKQITIATVIPQSVAMSTTVIGGKTPYDVLGIKSTASQADVKAAFYRLSKIYHPDVSTHGNAVERFTNIKTAYDILSHPKRRAEYDKHQRYKSPQSTSQDSYDPDYSNFMRHQTFKQRGSQPHYGRTRIYDYDEFYRKHYGEWIVNKKDQKEKQQQHMDSLRRHQQEGQRMLNMLMGIVVVFVIVSLLSPNHERSGMAYRKRAIESRLDEQMKDKYDSKTD